MRAFDMIEESKDLLNDHEGDLYNDVSLLRHLNRALRDVTSRARTIREVFYRQVNEGQSVYALPDGFLGNDKVAWLYANEWCPLDRRSLSTVEYLNNSDGYKSYRPFFYDIWGRTRAERFVSTVTAVSSTDGVVNPAFSGFPTHSETFGFRFSDDVVGIDAVRVGDVVINATDDAEGTVTEIRDISPGNRLFAAARLDGSSRLRDNRGRIFVDDEVRILSPSVSGHALRIAPPPDMDSAVGEEVLWMYLSRRHYEVEQSHIDNVNDMLELDNELETPALERMLYWCRREELGVSDNETIAQLQVYEAAYHTALPDIRQRIRDHESTWGTPSLAAYRTQIELEGVATTVGHSLNNVNIR